MWFDSDSVEEAVKASTTQHLPFFIYIHDPNSSIDLSDFFLSHEQFFKEKTIPYKMIPNSKSFEQLSQFINLPANGPILIIIFEQKIMELCPVLSVEAAQEWLQRTFQSLNIKFAPLNDEQSSDSQETKKILETKEENQKNEIVVKKKEMPTEKEEIEENKLQKEKNDEIRNRNECRILIRMTNGKSMKTTLPKSSKVSDLRTFIDQNRTDGDCPYSLLMVYPSRTLDGFDLKSLEEVDLFPNGSVLMKPLKNSVEAFPEQGSGIMDPVIETVSSFGSLIWTSVNSFWSGDQPLASSSSNSANNNEERKKVTSPTKITNRRSRIVTIHDSIENDDENKKTTYNGNSTSQQ